jgi:hypothetical protein
MGSMLETIKKGISALNPVGKPVDKKPVVKPVVVPKPIDSGYLGDSTRKASKHNKAIEDLAKEVQ